MPGKSNDVESYGLWFRIQKSRCFEIIYFIIDFVEKIFEINRFVLINSHITRVPLQGANQEPLNLFNITETHTEILKYSEFTLLVLVIIHCN